MEPTAAISEMTKCEQNLLLLESLIPKSERLYIWAYDRKCQLIATSCPDNDRDPLEEAFRMFGGEKRLLQYAEDAEETRPMIMGSSVGLQWAFSYESERNRDLIFVIGPVVYTAPNPNRFYAPLGNAAWAAEFVRLLPLIPVMSYPIFCRYVLLVHNTLTGCQMDLYEIYIGAEEQKTNETNIVGERDRKQVYLAERAMLRMVREGNINYQGALQNSMASSTGVPVEGRDPLRQMKTSIIVFTSLVCRAAMEGGLSPEIAYALGDSYIQMAEDCRDSGELSAMAHAMYHDFVYRVHYLRMNPNYSYAVQKCCDYIELSLNRKIRTADLSALVGYTDYYLTEKFKKETGKSISAYVKDAKIERAKLMLAATKDPVAKIAETLAFNTPNYFIQCFREKEGITPAQYRKRLAE